MRRFITTLLVGLWAISVSAIDSTTWFEFSNLPTNVASASVLTNGTYLYGKVYSVELDMGGTAGGTAAVWIVTSYQTILTNNTISSNGEYFIRATTCDNAGGSDARTNVCPYILVGEKIRVYTYSVNQTTGMTLRVRVKLE